MPTFMARCRRTRSFDAAFCLAFRHTRHMRFRGSKTVPQAQYLRSCPRLCLSPAWCHARRRSGYTSKHNPTAPFLQFMHLPQGVMLACPLSVFPDTRDANRRLTYSTNAMRPYIHLTWCHIGQNAECESIYVVSCCAFLLSAHHVHSWRSPN